MAPSFGKIEKGAAVAILDFDNPQVRIEGDLLLQPLFGGTLADTIVFVDAHPQPIDTALRGLRLRCRTIEGMHDPSSRSILTKITPASAAPRRRNTAFAPSTAQRRR